MNRRRWLFASTESTRPPRGIADAAKEFLSARRENILSVIEQPLAATPALGGALEIPTSFDGTVTFSGTFNASRATYVFLNGERVTIERWQLGCECCAGSKSEWENRIRYKNSRLSG